MHMCAPIFWNWTHKNIPDGHFYSARFRKTTKSATYITPPYIIRTVHTYSTRQEYSSRTMKCTTQLIQSIYIKRLPIF